jgi:hypothetical protein
MVARIETLSHSANNWGLPAIREPEACFEESFTFPECPSLTERSSVEFLWRIQAHRKSSQSISTVVSQ